DHQSRAGHEDERQRDFAGHEAGPDAPLRSTQETHSVAEGFARRAARAAARGHQAEENAGDDRNGEREQEHPAVQVHFVDPRDPTGGREFEQRAHARQGHADDGRRADQREQDARREERPCDAGAIATSWLCARSGVASARRRPMTGNRKELPGSSRSASGVQTWEAAGNVNPRGMTPTIVRVMPSRVIVLPRIAGSRLKRTRQSRLLRMTTRSLPVSSSSGVNPRPNAGCTPRTAKKVALARAPGSRVASPTPLSVSSWRW